MPYKLSILFLSFSIVSGQSLFNRWIGSEPFTGSARSTAMGNTHILNSSGSSNVRFNPANLVSSESIITFDVQLDRFGIFERWSMPVQDFFGDFLTNADYVANEFSHYGFRGGLSASTKLPGMGKVGFGFHYAPLTHFTYFYSEEVRGRYQTEDWEYASKDPIIGYQNLSTDGALMVSSLGGGMQISVVGDIDLSLGVAINFIQSSEITDRVEVEALYSDLTNLSEFPDIYQTTNISESDFITLSTKWKLNSNLIISSAWADHTKDKTDDFSWIIDSTNGLLQYWDSSTNSENTVYAIQGMSYYKPEVWSLAFNYLTDSNQAMTIGFELNLVLYNESYILKDYRIYKFGFEHLTQMGTPIRAGLTYQTPRLSTMNPISMFTFGTGKTIGNLDINASGTYCFHSFRYPDLFPIEGDVRPDYDLVRESQFHLQLGLNYKFQ